MGCDIAQMQCSGNSLHHFGVLRFQPRQCKIHAVQLGFVFDLSFYKIFAVLFLCSSLYPCWVNGNIV